MQLANALVSAVANARLEAGLNTTAAAPAARLPVWGESERSGSRVRCPEAWIGIGSVAAAPLRARACLVHR